MKLHFLGTTGYHPNNHRQTACLMLPEIGLIFDAGTGIFRARDLIQTDHLDIFLSHVHLDHCVGLTFLYDILWKKNVSRVTVHVAAEKINALTGALYHSDLFPVQPNFDIVALQPSTLLDSGATVQAIPVEHPGGAHAFRFESMAPTQSSFAYVTDTVARPDADYVSAIHNVTTLIHECYFPDGWEERAKLTGHSCLTPVAQVAAQANAQRLFLVHISPLAENDPPLDLSTIQDTFPGAVIAADQQIIEV